MLRYLLIFSLLLIYSFNLHAAPFEFLPIQITQPDGRVMQVYTSGDEFYHWIHDENGYTILRDELGFLCYADQVKGQIVASRHKVGEVDPGTLNLPKWIKISKEEYQKKKEILQIPAKTNHTKSPQSGSMNNLVIYIRFAGESEIQTTRQTYDNKLNPAEGNSLKAYFKEVSYNQMLIQSYHYPSVANPATANASYQDAYPRSYYQVYHSVSNPNGYSNDDERRNREHLLLMNAINWMNQNHPVSGSVNIDADNDGYVDNVSFMIKGDHDAWADLLWAHRWALYSQYAYINGKRVWDYTFQPENQVSVRTLCHEMFHVIGAPDLYHYDDGGLNLTPVGSWDIMANGSGHMSAYMKWKYSGQQWITQIPEITQPGTYTLHPLSNSGNNCFRIASPNSLYEFFVVEYRKHSGIWESQLPGEGLVIYRVNSLFEGNANFDNSVSFDELYVYRPGGTLLGNGNLQTAHFSANSGRTTFNGESDPEPFLTGGQWGGISISAIGTTDTTISFHFDGFWGEDSQWISFPAGWYIFSTGIKPNINELDNIFGSISGGLSLIKNESGLVYWPQFGVDQIDSLRIGEGYQVHMDQAVELEIAGSRLNPLSHPLQLQSGWNLLGYLLEEPHSADSVMESISGSIRLMKTYNGLIYWPDYQINSIGQMKPGEGYFLNMEQATTFIYNPYQFTTFNINDFTGSYSCSESGYGVYPVNFTADLQVSKRIHCTNFWDYAAAGSTVYFDFSGDSGLSINIPYQPITFADYTTGWVSGSGTYDPQNFSFQTVSTVIYGGYSYTAYHFYTK